MLSGALRSRPHHPRRDKLQPSSRTPPSRRKARRLERAAEQRIRRERDNTRCSDTTRRGAIEAERQREGGAGGPLHGGG